MENQHFLNMHEYMENARKIQEARNLIEELEEANKQILLKDPKVGNAIGALRKKDKPAKGNDLVNASGMSDGIGK